MKIHLTLIFAFTLAWRVYGDDSPGGYVVGWGENLAGQATGIAHNGDATGLVTVAGQVLDNITSISDGVNHCLAINKDGRVIGWGKTTLPSNLLDIVSVAAGGGHSLALKKDGTVVAWGDNHFGAVAVPNGLSNVVAIAAGFESCLALKKDGTVVGWGIAKTPFGLSNVVAIAASKAVFHEYYLALKNDGTVVQWDNRNGKTYMPGISNVVAIAAGAVHNLALKKNGTVIGWGFDQDGETDIPSGLSNVVAIAASGNDFPASGFSLALKRDGTVVAWGRMGYNQPATVPAGLSNVVAISAGGGVCLAITTNRAVAEKFMQK